ncbi:hypothetical protein IWQ56_002664 [Coemansia nantahalensis]|nr:hypothetical protein IWQ56_002664 [Coemansia nantahalensis]
MNGYGHGGAFGGHGGPFSGNGSAYASSHGGAYASSHGGAYSSGYGGGYGGGAYSSYTDDHLQQPGRPTSPREYLHTPVYPVPARPESAASTARDAASAQGGLLLDESAEKSPAKARGARRQCCGNGRYCWCCSKRCCCIFIPVLLVILAGLGVTLFFVFPRIPEVTFDRVDVVPKDGAALGQRGLTVGRRDGGVTGGVGNLLDNVSIDRQGTVTVPLVIHMNVTNPNYIPWTIHNVTVSGYLANSTAGGARFPVGDGGLRTPFHMAKKSAGNDMPLYFNFRLSTNATNYLPAAVTVQKACTPGGPKLRFYYHANVILRAISWLGIRPGFSDTISFDCPISEIESLGIQIADLTGLSPEEISGLI